MRVYFLNIFSAHWCKTFFSEICPWLFLCPAWIVGGRSKNNISSEMQSAITWLCVIGGRCASNVWQAIKVLQIFGILCQTLFSVFLLKLIKISVFNNPTTKWDNLLSPAVFELSDRRCFIHMYLCAVWTERNCFPHLFQKISCSF